MHYDKKIALALGILLVGVVGALFFRRESAEIPPRLADAGSLAERIRDKPIRPYELPQTGPALAQKQSASSAKQPTPEEKPSASQRPEQKVAASPLPPGSFDGAFPQNLRVARKSARNNQSAGTGRSSRLGPPEPLSPQDRHAGLRIAGIPAPDPNAGWKPQSDNRKTKQAGVDRTPPPALAGKRTGKTLTISQRKKTADEVIHYRVKPGDTLSGIALHFLGSSRRYREIFEANRDRLDDPDDLRPGMMLRIPNSSATHLPRNTIDLKKNNVRLQKNVENASGSSSGPSSRPPLLPTPSSRRENTPPAADGGFPGTRQQQQMADTSSRQTANRKEKQKEPDSNEAASRRKNQSIVPRPDEKNVPEQPTSPEDPPLFRPARHAPFVVGQRTAFRRHYVIRRGDTLEGISLRFYGHRRAVSAIRAANGDRLTSPRQLRPGTTIVLP